MSILISVTHNSNFFSDFDSATQIWFPCSAWWSFYFCGMPLLHLWGLATVSRLPGFLAVARTKETCFCSHFCKRDLAIKLESLLAVATPYFEPSRALPFFHWRTLSFAFSYHAHISHSSTLKYTATHCNTLQHTTTHCPRTWTSPISLARVLSLFPFCLAPSHSFLSSEHPPPHTHTHNTTSHSSTRIPSVHT